MSTITRQERALYEQMWDIPAYETHAPGEQYVSIFAEHVPSPARVLDAGTGSGKGALALAAAGYEVCCCDLTDAGLVEDARRLPFFEACLWRSLRPQVRVGWVDAVYCTDVLEHLPTQFTMLAVEQMLRLTERGVFVAVSLTPDQCGAWVGKSLHQTVQSFVWWRDSLREVGRVPDARDLLNDAVFWVERP